MVATNQQAELICTKTKRPTSSAMCEVCDRDCDKNPHIINNYTPDDSHSLLNEIQDIINISITFWEDKRDSCTIIGDTHGRTTAQTLVAVLDHIKAEIGKLNGNSN